MPIILDPLPPAPPSVPVLDETTDGYISLLTSQHNQRPKLVATLAALIDPVVAARVVIGSLPGAFDLDAAVGAQLDTVGEWLGRSRFIETELPNVFFSFGIEGQGFGQGTWFGPNDAVTGLSRLPDDTYRQLLYFTVLRNRWDGTVEQAVTILDTLLNSSMQLLLEDGGDMTMTIGLIGASDAVTLSLFDHGFFDLKPAGVGLKRTRPSVPGTPFFGFGFDNDKIGGFGHGSWAMT